MSPRWALYDQLIDSIPGDVIAEDVLLGCSWTLVRSAGVGLALTPHEGMCSLSGAGSLRGRTVRDLATLLKSWNPFEAALGAAAANSYWNAPATVDRQWTIDPAAQTNESVFMAIRTELTGKKVAVVGRFPDLGDLAPLCELSILERRPQAADFPDPACEFILAEQDYLFVTGTALWNKTLPRLLELGRNAKIVMVGPTVPLTPTWFGWGISMLAGTVVLDAERVWRHVAEGGTRSIFTQGARMVRLDRTDVR
ncbi:MAG: DUF364 domain-containing protein [Candidatus Binatia bacterium]